MNKAEIVQRSQLHRIFKPFYSGIGHVLMFHRVSRKSDYIITRGLEVSPEYLEGVIKFFQSKKIDIITLDECYNRITAKGKIKRFVSFTFDDGYTDNLTEALPVFEKYNVPFTVFLTTSYPDRKGVLWWYLLEKLAMENDKTEFIFNTTKHFYSTKTLGEKKFALWRIRRFILDGNHTDITSRLDSIFKGSSIKMYDLTEKLTLSWDQVIELSRHPLATIGAHTVNHLSLKSLTDDKVFEEITNSIKIIEDKIKLPVLYFAYPIGTHEEAGEREYSIASHCNIKMAFTAEKGNIFRKHATQLHSLPRVSINETMRLSHIELFINGLTPFMNKFSK